MCISITDYDLSTMSTVSQLKEVMSGYLHSGLLNTLLLGTYSTCFPLYLPYKMPYSAQLLTGIYTPLYFGTMYIYREIILSTTTVFTNQFSVYQQ